MNSYSLMTSYRSAEDRYRTISDEIAVRMANVLKSNNNLCKDKIRDILGHDGYCMLEEFSSVSDKMEALFLEWMDLMMKDGVDV